MFTFFSGNWNQIFPIVIRNIQPIVFLVRNYILKLNFCDIVGRQIGKFIFASLRLGAAGITDSSAIFPVLSNEECDGNPRLYPKNVMFRPGNLRICASPSISFPR